MAKYANANACSSFISIFHFPNIHHSTRHICISVLSHTHTLSQVREDTRWDEQKNVSKIKNWRNDSHTIHPNSHSAYSHYTQVGRTKLADSPRWPARDVLNTNVSSNICSDKSEVRVVVQK